MEKRALLAFVLSLAVVLVWEIFFPPQPRKRDSQSPAPQQTVSKTGAREGKEKERAIHPHIKGISPDAVPTSYQAHSSMPSKTWVVKTPLYRAVITSAGARLERFQLMKHRQSVDPSSPPMELIPEKGAGYYPLAVDLVRHPDWALSTRLYDSDAPKLIQLGKAQRNYNLVLKTTVDGKIEVTKTYIFNQDNYDVRLKIRVVNLADVPLEDQIGLSTYTLPFGRGKKESSYNRSKVSVYRLGKLTHYDQKKLLKKKPVFESPLDWAGYENNYFLQAIMPPPKVTYKVVPRIVDERTGLVQIVYLADPLFLKSHGAKAMDLIFYFGPKELEHLKKADHRLDRAIDYGWFTLLAKWMLVLLKWIHRYIHNYGWAIIVLTVLVKIVTWPLTHKSYKSMQVMKKIQPKMAEIREKYKDDKEKLNQELMMLYRTYKVNPMGGCLPMILQIPIFFALYRMLYGAIELRHQPFYLWINDLTAPDRLPIGVHIPYLGSGLPVLTILMGISMFIQQKMTPASADPRQEKMMLLMPVIFTVFFINFPSGLVLYWLVNNVLSIVQQYWINRHA